MFSVVPLILLVVRSVLAAPNTNVVYLKNTEIVDLPPVVSPFIVGGKDDDISKHLHLVSLLIDFGSTGRALCGGTIINCNWVLTAAHCFHEGQDLTARGVVIRSESNYYNTGGYTQSGTLVVTFKYNSSRLLNDLVLVKVANPFRVCDVKNPPILLPVQGSKPAEDTNAVIAGWGTTSEGGSLPRQLQSANVTIVNQETCRKAYGSIVQDSMLCAGVSEGGIDSCQGDSGGPIVVSGVIVGIVSYGNGCARKGYPGVYTNVGSYRDAIDSVVQKY